MTEGIAEIRISNVSIIRRHQSFGRRTSFGPLYRQRPIVEWIMASHERRIRHFLVQRPAQRQIRLRPLLLSRTRGWTERHHQRIVERSAERSGDGQRSGETRARERRLDVEWESVEKGLHRSSDPHYHYRRPSTALDAKSIRPRLARYVSLTITLESLLPSTRFSPFLDHLQHPFERQ